MATALAVLVLAAGFALNVRLTHGLTRVDGAFDPLDDRPAAAPGTTLLLIGIVPAGATSASGVQWLPTRPALESVMLVHVRQDGRHVTVDSIEIVDTVAAEMTTSDPSRAVAEAEVRSGRRIDHLVVVDWSDLQQLADDNAIGLTYHPGCSIRRQQEFMKATLVDTLHAEMRTRPWSLYAALDTVSRGMAVDSGWSMLEMDRLLFSLRDLRSAQIEFGALAR